MDGIWFEILAGQTQLSKICKEHSYWSLDHDMVDHNAQGRVLGLAAISAMWSGTPTTTMTGHICSIQTLASDLRWHLPAFDPASADCKGGRKNRLTFLKAGKFGEDISNTVQWGVFQPKCELVHILRVFNAVISWDGIHFAPAWLSHQLPNYEIVKVNICEGEILSGNRSDGFCGRICGRCETPESQH